MLHVNGIDNSRNPAYDESLRRYITIAGNADE